MKIWEVSYQLLFYVNNKPFVKGIGDVLVAAQDEAGAKAICVEAYTGEYEVRVTAVLSIS